MLSSSQVSHSAHYGRWIFPLKSTSSVRPFICRPVRLPLCMSIPLFTISIICIFLSPVSLLPEEKYPMILQQFFFVDTQPTGVKANGRVHPKHPWVRLQGILVAETNMNSNHFPHFWPFMRGLRRWSPLIKGHLCGELWYFCVVNCSTNSRYVGDLKLAARLTVL